MECVLWDWNGTLLDDAEYAVSVRNRIFPRFGLPALSSMAEYHAQFTFPVRTYYERAGVTDENFVAVANAWMDEYVAGCADLRLMPDALWVLDRFRASGARQAVLSASHVETLRAQLARFPILPYFDELLGLDHIYATSKEHLGREYLKREEIAPERTALLGDTLHDAEVAKALGCRCVLIARGHQSRETLLTAGVPVTATLTEACELLTQ